MLKIFRTLFGLYAVIIFAISLLVTVPMFFIVFLSMGKKAPFIAHNYISRPWARILLILYFLRLNVKGKNLINPNQTYVFVSNHLSMLDIPIIAVACKNSARFLSKAELTKIPLLGYVISKLYITVNRSDSRNRLMSLQKMKDSISEGISVFLYPEGTRNKTKEPLLNFHDGAFRLAIETQTPLAVLTIINSGKFLSPNRTFELSPGIIKAVWNKPIETKGMAVDDVSKLKETVINIMLANLSAKKYDS